MAKTPMTCTPVKKATKAKIVSLAALQPKPTSLTAMMEKIIEHYISSNGLELDVTQKSEEIAAATATEEAVESTDSEEGQDEGSIENVQEEDITITDNKQPA